MTVTPALRDQESMSGNTYRNLLHGLRTFGLGLADIADDDPRVVAGSADLKVSTLFIEFAERHPERCFQYGISERNMVSAAAGMASTGLLPFVSTFASFASLMCLEQMRTDLAYPGMPVRVVGTHAGLAIGYLSTSHHATEDIAATRAVANLTVLSPPDGPTAVKLVRDTMDWPGPAYIRLGRGLEPNAYETVPDGYRVGEPYVARAGDQVALIATGLMVRFALDAADELERGGVSATVLDVHTLKPFDGARVAEIAAAHDAVVTVEEHNVEGGLGTLVREALYDHGVIRPTYKHGLQDEFSVIGAAGDLYRYYGLDGHGIATVATRLLDGGGPALGGTPAGSLWTSEDKRSVLEQYDHADLLGQLR